MPLRSEYFVFVAALGASAITTLLIFLFLIAFPLSSFLMYIVFKEGGSTSSYMFVFMVSSFPAIFVFGSIMKNAIQGFGFTFALICYLVGHLFLLVLLPFIASPILGPAGGIGIFVSAALTLGFGFTKLIVGNTDRKGDYNHPGWEGYQ